MAVPPVLQARGLRKRYARREVLRGVDLDLYAGELVALLGPNGAGKTTLMSLLVGAVRPDGGTVSGESSSAGWVPQAGGTYGRLTVRENLELFSGLLRLPGDRAKLAAQAAARAGLEPWFDNQAAQLSGGLRQRLNIAVGTLGDPAALVLDEPTTGVDLVHRHGMWGMLRERAAAGCAVLYSTHSGDDAALADRVLVLVDGRMSYAGPLAGIASFADASSVGPDGLVAGLPVDAVSRGLLALWEGGVAT
jgi:ABC-2 type transport system ATP-binding protein